MCLRRHAGRGNHQRLYRCTTWTARTMDPYFDETAHTIVLSQQDSTSMIQRRFSIGYNRAGRLMDQLEAAGIVGKAEGSKPREVLLQDIMSLEHILDSL